MDLLPSSKCLWGIFDSKRGGVRRIGGSFQAVIIEFRWESRKSDRQLKAREKSQSLKKSLEESRIEIKKSEAIMMGSAEISPTSDWWKRYSRAEDYDLKARLMHKLTCPARSGGCELSETNVRAGSGAAPG